MPDKKGDGGTSINGEVKSGGKFGKFQPGIISEELRHALGRDRISVISYILACNGISFIIL